MVAADEEEGPVAGGGRWRQEMEAARHRSGQLLTLLAALLATLILLNTALLNLPLLAGAPLAHPSLGYLRILPAGVKSDTGRSLSECSCHV